MSKEIINCVFIQPDFYVSDILSIVLYVDQPPKSIPSLSIIVNNQKYSLQTPTVSDGDISWNLNSICDFAEEAPQCDIFSLDKEGRIENYLLNQLLFLGPKKTAKPPLNTFLIEFPSGIYIRKKDYKDSTVSFSVDSILTLELRNIKSIQMSMAKLDEEKKKFEEKKKELGIDFQQLSNLKAQYEQSLREKRRMQYLCNQKEKSLKSQTEQANFQIDSQHQIQQLKEHIENNQKKISEKNSEQTSPNSYKKLLQFRLDALNELKGIFPFNENEKRICSVVYNANPTQPKQWNELKAFLGFATHYIHEVSRIVGVPMRYNLSPRAGLSMITDRVSMTQWSIPTEDNIEKLHKYESILVACSQIITDALFMERPKNGNITLLSFLSKLNSIGQKELETLQPL